MPVREVVGERRRHPAARLRRRAPSRRRGGPAGLPPARHRRGPGELAALIDGYLSRAPRRAFDAAAFAHTTAELTVDELQRSLDGSGGLWPALLPRLRHRAGLKRSELVTRLAGALGAGDRIPRVAGYYHLMEQGRLPAAGVSDRVLQALGEILDETAPALREAGAALSPATRPPAAGAAFARRVTLGESDAEDTVVASSAAAAASDPPADPDDLDALFIGGP